MIETDLPAFLAADAQIKARVVTGSFRRIFPLIIPQHAFDETAKQPCLVYRRSGATRQPLFCQTDKLIAASFQLDAYAREYIDAIQLGNAVRKALVDYSGAMGSTTVARVFLEFEADFEDPEPGLFHVSQTYTFWYFEE